MGGKLLHRYYINMLALICLAGSAAQSQSRLLASFSSTLYVFRTHTHTPYTHVRACMCVPFLCTGVCSHATLLTMCVCPFCAQAFAPMHLEMRGKSLGLDFSTFDEVSVCVNE